MMPGYACRDADERPDHCGRTPILRLACILLTFLGSLPAFGYATYNISAGAGVSTIQSTIITAAAAAGNNTVQFAAGSYNITSQVYVPCPSGTLTIQGPVVAYRPPSDLRQATYSYSSPYQAILIGPVDNNWGFSVGACAPGQAITIQYLEWNGGQPAAGGGGWIYVAAGNNNLTIQDNYCHGMYANTAGSHSYDGCIWLDGPQAPTPITANTLIQWNVFGDGNSDCNPIMQLYFYQGGGFDSAGAACNGVGWQASTTNLSILHNDFEHVEEGLKGIEHGGSASAAIFVNNGVFEYNDFGQIHRIGFESQQFINVNATTGSTYTVKYNSMHDTYYGAFGSWGFSLPQCCAGYLGISSDEEETVDDNSMIGNAPPTGSYYPPAFEYWSAGGPNGHANNNFGQGYWGAVNTGNGYEGASMVSWGCTDPTAVNGIAWQTNNNIFQSTAPGSATVTSEGTQDAGSQCPTNPEIPPSESGNIFQSTIAPLVSTTPTISPKPSGSYSSPVTVTIANTGNVNGPGPRSNQNAFCTTDGSAPTVNSQFYASGSQIAVAPGTTVKCIGMWGAQNQPHVWQTSYGWVPSSVVSATYGSSGSSSAKPVLTSVTVTVPKTSLKAGSSGAAAMATCNHSDGSSADCSTAADSYGFGPAIFQSSNSSIAAIASGPGAGAGVITPLTPGTAILSAKVAGMTSAAALTVTPSTAPLSLVAVSLSNSGAVHSMFTGASIQMTATCTYSDGSTTNCTKADSHGNAVAAWASGDKKSVMLSASGLASAMAPGSSDLTARVNEMVSPSWLMSVAAPALSSVVLGTTDAATSLKIGASNQLLSTCKYSDGTTTNCTTTDVNGNQVSPWTSSNTAVATISSGGVVTGVGAGSTDLKATVLPSSTATQWGPMQYTTAGTTYAGYINANYVVLGSQAGGYTGGTCSFYLPANTLTVGAEYDCGLIPAPTPTTQGSAWQCHYTYTVSDANWAGGWITGTMSDCGNLEEGSAWWVALNTNQAGPSTAGFYNCGSSCNGSAPKAGSGTYACSWIAAPYGKYTGMSTAMNHGCGALGVQATQYVTLGQGAVDSNILALTVAPATPTLTSIYITSAGNASTMVVGRTLQFTVWGVFSDGSVQKLPDAEGNVVNLWNTSNHTIARISTLGHATALRAGTVNIIAHSGALIAAPKTITVTPASSKAPSTVTAKDADASGVAADSQQAVSPEPQAPGAPLADSFGGPLWSLTAPAGGSASISEGHLYLGVPGGSNHSATSGANNAVRVIQPVGNESFDVSMEIDSSLSASEAGTSQGLLVESDDRNYILYGLETDGTRIGLSLYMVSAGASATVLPNSDLASYQNPIYLRMTRSGSAYVAYYSVDGQNWIQAAAFSSTMAPTAMGPFAGNYSDVPANAVPVVMSVGSFVAH